MQQRAKGAAPRQGPQTRSTHARKVQHGKAGLEEFNPAFVGLLGDDVQLTATEMQEFEDFLATIAYPPNPFRNLDNTLPAITIGRRTTDVAREAGFTVVAEAAEPGARQLADAVARAIPIEVGRDA